MEWNKRDKTAIWHPCTPQWKEEYNINIVRGKGIYLYDDQGNEYIDAVSSWWVNLHGHAHPHINERLKEQLDLLEHVIFAGFTHQPAIELAEEILKLLPENQSKIFYSDNGSTAVEVAIKITMQYWYNIGQKKLSFIAFENSYHGDTFGSMAVGADSPFNDPYGKPAFNVIHIPTPTSDNIQHIVEKITHIHQQYDIAGFIFEPLVQGWAGMLMYEAELLEKIIRHCKQLNIITIADEVMTGFGRTGAMFACDHLDEAPDIFCLSKGITGGYMALGATSCTSKIYHAYLQKDPLKTFYHGHSYTANPLACTAGLASLEIFKQPGYIDEIIRIVYKHQAFLYQLQNHPKVKNARQTGTILAFDIKNNEPTGYFNSKRDQYYYAFLKKGVLLRPLGNTIYLIPPYCITNEELDKVYAIILETLKVL
ncbi:MAG: adenosylmethionine--8-amino-7-oxononanoate transaminase [Chitinophagales bacterium]|nr:adenosylmethionine--8-amino-7-oxononanoate transaminase [Chitinophagales bacterium]MCZ2392812.1 adenosylmethionine--8-amino-7-oxononanoate transaminase [Chitinophagales bacterium]